jgi:hypothetical protein
MKKKILFLALLLLLPSIVKGATVSINITDIISDSYVEQDDPNSNFGSTEYAFIRDHTANAERYYIMANLTAIPQNVTIISAYYCLEMLVDGATNNISLYQVLNQTWSEDYITWNNQPCGTAFNDSTNCNLTVQDSKITTGVAWYCWNATKCVTNSYALGEENHSWVFKTEENDTLGADRFTTKEGIDAPYLEVTYLPLETNLSLTFEPYFAVDEQNLVEANYSLYADSSPILNATCNFTSELGNATMSYNNTTTFYEVYVTPDVNDTGIIEFTVNCTKEPYEPQYETQTITSGVFAGTPYNWTIELYEDRNATTRYLDEFSWLLVRWLDYNATPITGEEYYIRAEEYNNGHADFNDTIAIGNYSLYYYSGELNFPCEGCSPSFASFNDFMFLGNFVNDENRTVLALWVNPIELNFWTEVKGYLITYGVIIGGFVLAILSAIGIYLLTDKKTLAVIVFMLVLWSAFAVISWLGISDTLPNILGLYS